MSQETTESALRNLANLVGLHDLDLVDDEEDDEVLEALRIRSRVDDIFAAQAVFLARAVERIVTTVAPLVRDEQVARFSKHHWL
jgi:hypothetical protein